jgi:type IV secretory pathway VirJ component
MEQCGAVIQLHHGFVGLAQHARRPIARALGALCVSVGAVLLCHCSAPGGGVHQEVISHGQFAHLHIYRTEAAPRRLAVLLSGDGGWDSGSDAIAKKLALQGTLVGGINVREWLATLEQAAPSCVAPGAYLADLIHYLQAQYALAGLPPVLIGHSAGATLAYVALVQARPHTFAAVLTLSFCVDLDLSKPLCPAPALRAAPRAAGVRLLPGGAVPDPWVTLHGLEDRVCPAAEARRFADAIPGARFIPVPDNGHTYDISGYWWGPFIDSYHQLTAAPGAFQPTP